MPATQTIPVKARTTAHNDTQSSVKQVRPTHGVPDPSGGIQARNTGLAHDDIATRAYYCWRERGCPEGSPHVDWERAEDELSRASGTVVGSQASEPM